MHVWTCARNSLTMGSVSCKQNSHSRLTANTLHLCTYTSSASFIFSSPSTLTNSRYNTHHNIQFYVFLIFTPALPIFKTHDTNIYTLSSRRSIARHRARRLFWPIALSCKWRLTSFISISNLAYYLLDHCVCNITQMLQSISGRRGHAD